MSAHPGVRYTVEVYVCSDQTGLQVCVWLASPRPMPAVKDAIDPVTLLSQFGKSLPNAAPDWRFMSDSEIEDYRADL